MAAATMYVTVAGAGDNSGDSWANAMALSDWQSDVEGGNEAGDIYYVAGGTYTLTSAWDAANSGTTALPITIIGVKTGTTAEPPTLSDHAFGSDRPLIAAAAYNFTFIKNYWDIFNLQVTTTNGWAFRVNGYNHVVNCKVTQSSGSAYPALYDSSFAGVAIGCELISTNGYGLSLSAEKGAVIGCYIHDSNVGINLSGQSKAIVGNVFDTCTTGIALGAIINILVNNTFYGCTTAITGGSNYSTCVVNNIFDANTTGVSWTSEFKSNFFDFNIWDNTTDATNVTKGRNAVTSDPAMTDPSNGDFTLGSGSPALDAGVDASTYTDATV